MSNGESSAAYTALVPDAARLPPTRHARVSGTMGLFQACTWLRGEIPFMLDLLDDEPFCRALIERLGAFLACLGEQVARRTGTVESAFWVYDDFSINTGPLISPDLFERLFLGAYRKLLGCWRAIGIRHLVLHHDVLNETTFPILDMLFDAGITAVQGVYPTAGLCLARFRNRYGRRLAVIGGMCNTHTLPFGSPGDIEREVAAVTEIGSDGGVIIGSHSIEGYVPVRNYDAYVQALDRAERGAA
jgi:uroporphyrinogen decarboxylase